MTSCVRKHIVKQIGDSFFCLLIDEARDESTKEQMSLVLKFIDSFGVIHERFLDMNHVVDTRSELLMVVIVSTLSRHSLSLSRVRGQGYDGASNMRGDINGLKTMIQRENSSAYYVLCFAHRLQLALISATKNHIKVCRFFVEFSSSCVTIGASCKRADQFQELQAANIRDAIVGKEMKTGRGLNQEQSTIYEAVQSFCLAKTIVASNMESSYVLMGRPCCNADSINCDHYYLVKIFFNIVDSQLSELDDRFPECLSTLLAWIAYLCLDYLRNGNVSELVELGWMYPHDFEQYDLMMLEQQILQFSIELRLNEAFFGIQFFYALTITILVLILPVGTASTELLFSALKIVKMQLRNKMRDVYLADAISLFVERE
ncbi:hypothetical protein MPTK2_4g18190 [Marchantia polymorpha subsp. ruderalis]